MDQVSQGRLGWRRAAVVFSTRPETPSRCAPARRHPAADIAGYSRLMDQDEDATVRDLKGHQAAILPLVGRHGGHTTLASSREHL
jgi:class 3 adenylate cyclase